MGNTSSSSGGSEGPVYSTSNDYNWPKLNNLYNTPVTSAEIVERNLLGSGGSAPFIRHKGVHVTTADRGRYLIYSTDISNAQVITEARHMFNNWKPVKNLVPRGNSTVGDLMKSAKKDGGYNRYKNNCWHTVDKVKNRHFK
ncbi:hypothetical protein RclHR1_03240022 [Rhizophagus clarus]|uniref:Cell wall integrity and stress response component 1-like n=1 Tax=Rhizophagus clarus TaxID=94130 RepID=A0A2Z6R855_9GLOM|nr:hypothetical protein RclHR1_03240022 [Rhizophagus clarus]GES74878.1 cell wall integrity and stress response component 1-like [Rhizophagus clarus]